MNGVNPSFVAREAERMAQGASGKQAMVLNQIAVGCMVLMALPCVIQAVDSVIRTYGHLTHAQRANMDRVGRHLDERSVRGGDRTR